jgi:hypothetical protein
MGLFTACLVNLFARFEFPRFLLLGICEGLDVSEEIADIR